MSSFGKLYLLPVPVSDSRENNYIPEYNILLIRQLKYFIAEDAKTARRFLKWFGYAPIDNAEILILNEHTKNNEISSLLNKLLEGQDVGLMSDAGCPGIADPGAAVVTQAHLRGIRVVPLAGPSSIVLSIMASGFNGQNFAFIGYLPIDKIQKSKKLKDLESLVKSQRQAQFFIETPYRNMQLLEAMLETLQLQTSIFIGMNITSPDQILISKTVSQWKSSVLPDLHKIPTVFGIFQHYQ